MSASHGQQTPRPTHGLTPRHVSAAALPSVRRHDDTPRYHALQVSNFDCYSRICDQGVCTLPFCVGCTGDSEGECRQDLDYSCVPWVEAFIPAGGTACSPGSTPCIPKDGGEECNFDADW